MKLFFVIFDELQVKGSDFKLQLKSLGVKSEYRNVVINASEIPVLVWVVGASRLEKSHRGKLHGRELDLASGLLKLEITTDE